MYLGGRGCVQDELNGIFINPVATVSLPSLAVTQPGPAYTTVSRCWRDIIRFPIYTYPTATNCALTKNNA